MPSPGDVANARLRVARGSVGVETRRLQQPVRRGVRVELARRPPARRASASAVPRAASPSGRAAMPSAIASISAAARALPAAPQLAVLDQPGAVLVDRGDDVVDALAARRRPPAPPAAATRPARARRGAIMPWMSRYGGVGAVAVGLVDHEHVGDLEDAGLDRLDARRPCPGASSTSVVSASEATSTSAWPTPTVSTSTTSQPAPSSTRTACGVAAASPPRWPAAGHRPDVDARVGGVVLHADPVAEDRAAGERAGRVDGEHADPVPAARAARGPARWWWSTCPRPGEPVRPTTCAWPVCGASAAATSGSSSSPSSTRRDQAGDRARVTRRGPARPAPGRPGCVVASRPGQHGRSLAAPVDDQRVALAAAAAQRRRAGAAAAPLAAPARASAPAGRRDMPIGWPSAIAPPLTLTIVGADAQLAGGLDADRGERLVDLDEVEVGDGQAGLRQRVR